MLAGYHMDDPNDDLLTGNNRASIHEFREFINSLVHQGYLNTAGLMPMMATHEYNNVNAHGETPMVANTWDFRHPSDNVRGPAFAIWNAPYKSSLTHNLWGHTLTSDEPDGTNLRIARFIQGNGMYHVDYDYNIPMPARIPTPQAPPPPPPPSDPQSWVPPPPPLSGDEDENAKKQSEYMAVLEDGKANLTLNGSSM
jgi:hypothetical protein